MHVVRIGRIGSKIRVRKRHNQADAAKEEEGAKARRRRRREEDERKKKCAEMKFQTDTMLTLECQERKSKME